MNSLNIVRDLAPTFAADLANAGNATHALPSTQRSTAPAAEPDQDEGPFETALDISRLLRTPPETEAADEQPLEHGGIELPLESAEDATPEDGPLEVLQGNVMEQWELAQFELGATLGAAPSSAELDSDPDALDQFGERERARLELGAAWARMPKLEPDDEGSTGQLESMARFGGFLDLNALELIALDEADELPAHDERAASGELQVQTGESRFRASYRVQEAVSAAALFKDGLLAAGVHLLRIAGDGQSQTMTRVPAPVRQLLVHEAEGWAVFSTRDDRLYRVTEGAWQPQAVALPRGLTLGPDLQLFILEDQPKVLAAGVLWDLVGRATQLVPDPSVQRVRRLSEPSAEYAVCRGPSGFNLVHLLHNSVHPSQLDWGNPRTLLASAGGRLATLSSRGELCLMNKPNDVRQRVTIPEPVLALTMGVVAGETLVWLARQTAEAELELLEVEFSTGTATRIFALPWRNREPWAQLLWSVPERVLHLITASELVALKRLEA